MCGFILLRLCAVTHAVPPPLFHDISDQVFINQSLLLHSVVRDLLNALMLLKSCLHNRLTKTDIKGTGVCLCCHANVNMCVCMCVCVCITQHTGLAVITAECIVTSEWTKKIHPPSHFLPQDWPTQLASPIQLAPNFRPSHPIGPPGAVAWLHQKLIYLSRAGCLLQHFYRQSAECDNLTHTHTHRFRGHHTMHPGDVVALLLNLLVLTLTPQSAQLG